MRHYGDITQLSGYELPVVDCIFGGSPCQNLSIAGNRDGLDGKQSALFLHQIRITREMRERDRRAGRPDWLVRPRYMCWENVPGAFTSGKINGADFAKVIEEIIKIAEPGAAVSVRIPDGGWPKSGCYYAEDGSWSLAYRLHDSQWWGVPQRRKRISLVADFGGLTAAEILFNPQLRRAPEGGSAYAALSGAGGESGPEVQLVGQSLLWDSDASEAERKDPTPDNGRGADRPEPVTYDARGNGDGNVVCTITGDHNNRVTDYTALVVERPMAVSIGNGQLNQISMLDLANTLDTMHDAQAVIVFDKEMYNYGSGFTGEPQAREDDVAPTVRADTHPSGVAYKGVVRRLTPLECERLQGFPDNWSNIGTYEDAKGRARPAADSPRYRALGNSMAKPFWFQFLRRISAQYERPATLGSLFDGLGMAPLCWEECNGKGTALWASEIDPFCIAVTKKHFPEE